ncbi:MAG: leucyl/phenylalanyl-tRNA--protein transferase [Bdellovibrionia bacterium]
MGLGHVLKLPLIDGLFPDPEDALEGGVVCVGGPLAVPVLVTAYYNGIFPWPHPDMPLLWFSPEKRGVLDFKNLHVPRSLSKEMRKGRYRFTIDRAFAKVIAGCAKVPRREGAGTWITGAMKKAYIEMHTEGYAHSLEAWDGDELVGGIYGVLVAGCFSGESMFGLKPNVSKMCLVNLAKHLESLGLEWMDIQMVTPVTGLLGGREIERKDYLKRLRAVHKKASLLKWTAGPDRA